MNDAATDGLVDSSPPPTLSPRNKRKIELIDSLLRSLDVLTLVQISVLYYLDASTTLLLLRALSQIFFVSPYPGPLEILPQAPPVLFANILCILTHLFQARPESTVEGARGYLHGGLLVDFVGELGPTSKWRLFILDIFVFVLQLIMLVGALEKYSPKPPSESADAVVTDQDHDAEEAGLRRSGDLQRSDFNEDEDGFELQDMTEASPEAGTGIQIQNSHPSDRFYTGDVILVQLNVIEGLKTLLRKNAAASSPPATGAMEGGIIDLLLTRLAEDRSRRGQG